MREIVFTVSFVVLLLIGFLATPGLFKIISPEYLLALREYSAPLEKLRTDILDADNKIFEFVSKIDDHNFKATLAKDLDVKSQESAAAAQLAGTVERLKQRKKQLENGRDELIRKIDAAAGEGLNLYLVTRALALGAIGALMSILASLLSISKARAIFDDKGALTKIWASIAIGAVVAVVVIGLFFTGFISIFSQAQQVSGTPDFWKVTILCLLAGAFSDRLFQAASNKMELYLGSGEAGTIPAARDHNEAALSKTPSRKRRAKDRKASRHKSQ